MSASVERPRWFWNERFDDTNVHFFHEIMIERQLIRTKQIQQMKQREFTTTVSIVAIHYCVIPMSLFKLRFYQYCTRNDRMRREESALKANWWIIRCNVNERSLKFSFYCTTLVVQFWTKYAAPLSRLQRHLMSCHHCPILLPDQQSFNLNNNIRSWIRVAELKNTMTFLSIFYVRFDRNQIESGKEKIHWKR